nr:MAG TPA: hypothetical protein [Caudoviricetes sp.]
MGSKFVSGSDEYAQRECRVGEMFWRGTSPQTIAELLDCSLVDVIVHLDAMELPVPYEVRAATRAPAPRRVVLKPRGRCDHGKRRGNDKWGRPFCRACTPD